MTREEQLQLLARAEVAMLEVDLELTAWRRDLRRHLMAQGQTTGLWRVGESA